MKRIMMMHLMIASFFIAITLNTICSAAVPELLPDEIIYTVDPVEPIDVVGYSVPCYYDWNNDGANDLIIGQGGGGNPGKVRIYLNSATSADPEFTTYHFLQAGGQVLEYTWDGCNCGCMGLYPRVVYWNNDEKKDLLVGTADGYVLIFINIGTDSDPVFDAGTRIQYTQYGNIIDIASSRTTPNFMDYNNDGLKDLVVGTKDGFIHVYLNEGTEGFPYFITRSYALTETGNLVVPSERASPAVIDFNGDNKKDIVSGNTDGQLLFYENIGTDAAPIFADGIYLTAANETIDMPDTPRSRPFICDFNGDGQLDIFVGAADGLVHLYRAVTPGDVNRDGDIDFLDLHLMAAQWLAPPGCTDYETQCADITGNDGVDFNDFVILAQNLIND